MTPIAQDGGYGEALRPGERNIAPYAASASPSRGRLIEEPPCPTRSPWQRDRDRVLHATAFRRLMHKTQVFLYHEGDHYRTRLTHSLEVAQIARTIARQLRLDEDLAEALALAHDLGHPPFGHAGERALDLALSGAGGFDHNAQSLRVVMRLERKYAAFDGLNLTWEALEGLVKHNGPVTHPAAAVAKVVRPVEAWQSLCLGTWGSGEAQVAAIADDIAYSTHDVDDGLRAGLIRIADLADIPIAGAAARGLDGDGGGRAVYEVTRRMITRLIFDVVAESRRRLAACAPRCADDIRAAGEGVVGFSASMAGDIAALKTFLFQRVYRHDKVMRVMSEAEAKLALLFARYVEDDAALPAPWRERVSGCDARQRVRIVGDFVAGMTDRYALAEHERLYATGAAPAH